MFYDVLFVVMCLPNNMSPQFGDTFSFLSKYQLLHFCQNINCVDCSLAMTIEYYLVICIVNICIKYTCDIISSPKTLLPVIVSILLTFDLNL